MKKQSTFYVLISIVTLLVTLLGQISPALAQTPTPTPTPTPTDALTCPNDLLPGVTCSVMPDGSLKFDVSGYSCGYGDNGVASALLGRFASDITTYFSAQYVQIEQSNSEHNIAFTDLKYLRFSGPPVPGMSAPKAGNEGFTSQVENRGYAAGYPDSGVPTSRAAIVVMIGADWPMQDCRISGTFYISTSPINTCDPVAVKESNTYNIDPVIEYPQGPNPVPPAVADEQIAATVIGEWYRIRTTGQWDNGSAVIRGPELNAFAYSLDGDTWQGLEAIPDACVDSDGLTWQATADEFHIRVDDAATEFEDNTEVAETELTYTLEAVEAVTECGAAFSYDPQNDWLASGVLASNNSSPHAPAANFVVGDWYALETAGQPWWDETYTDRYDIRVSTPLLPGVQGPAMPSEFSVWPYTTCVEPTGVLLHQRYYFQMPATAMSLWVNDDVLFDNPLSHIGYNIYHVQHLDIPTDCEANFNLTEKITDDVIDGRQNYYELNPIEDILEPSITPKWVAGNYYMLSTKGGPWFDENPIRQSWEIEITGNEAGGYSALGSWIGKICLVEVDPVGHIRLYFKYNGGENFRIRAADDDMSGNSGSLGFELWKASSIDAPDGQCEDHYDKFPEFNDVDVPPAQSTGTVVPMTVAGTTYVMETRGYWAEGADAEIHFATAAISDDNGLNWYPWDEYPDRLCFETFMVGDQVYYRLYFQVMAGRRYLVRALDIDDNFSNNTNGGDFGIKIWKVTNTDDPWEQCARTWKLTPVKTGQIIPSNLVEGVIVETTPGKRYAIEITGGQWLLNGAGDPQFDAELSQDSNNWYEWNDKDMPGWMCVVTQGLEPYARIYFEATKTALQNTRVRVNGEPPLFTSNTGQLTYTLYSAVDIDDPEDPGDGDGYAGCQANILRPTYTPMTAPDADILEAIIVGFENIGIWFRYLGGWFPYITNSVMTFFLWCPEHDAMIKAMISDAEDKEPFGTAIQIKSLVEKSRARVLSYDWTTEDALPSFYSTTDTSSPLANFLSEDAKRGYAPSALDGGLSPYNGGQIVYDTSIFETGTVQMRTAGGGVRTMDIDSCSANVTVTFGSSGLIVGFCTVMNLLKLTGVADWLNLFLVIGAVAAFLNYFFTNFVTRIAGLVMLGRGVSQVE